LSVYYKKTNHMRLRLLFTLGLVLCMATIASSNECLRNCHHATACKASSGNASAGKASAENASSGKASTGSTSDSEATGVQAETPAQPVDGEYSTLLVSKLLYI